MGVSIWIVCSVSSVWLIYGVHSPESVLSNLQHCHIYVGEGRTKRDLNCTVQCNISPFTLLSICWEQTPGLYCTLYWTVLYMYCITFDIVQYVLRTDVQQEHVHLIVYTVNCTGYSEQCTVLRQPKKGCNTKVTHCVQFSTVQD